MAAKIAIEIEVRRIPPGKVRFEALTDHLLSVHSGAPARVSCHSAKVRSVSTRGEVCVLPVGASDECFQDDASDVLDIRLPCALVRHAAEDMGLDPARAGLELQFGIRDQQIEHIAWALEAEHRSGMSSGSLYRESLGLALAAHLLTRYGAPTPTRLGAGLSSKQLARVTEYIEEHLAGDVSLLRLARLAGASSSHFRVLFKRSTGLPVHEYVIRRRVTRAQALLVEGKVPASQVATEAGFSHQSHMARCMRRVLGVTPGQLMRGGG